ncbi:primosomal protein [Arthrobacter sp. E3]|uniref:primosomal protein n=1 Tax=Arthrobacter sp. E3 TaxID=517402 RepID=UPI001A943D38|nr:primosomal protein [Arthrobacter sp. E3]
MSIDPREALSALTSALEEHLVAASARRGEEDPIVEATFLGIIDAFEAYEEALFDAFDEVTPLVIYGEDDGDFDDDDSDEDDDEDSDDDTHDDSDDDDDDEESNQHKDWKLS